MIKLIRALSPQLARRVPRLVVLVLQSMTNVVAQNDASSQHKLFRAPLVRVNAMEAVLAVLSPRTKTNQVLALEVQVMLRSRRSFECESLRSHRIDFRTRVFSESSIRGPRSHRVDCRTGEISENPRSPRMDCRMGDVTYCRKVPA